VSREIDNCLLLLTDTGVNTLIMKLFETNKEGRFDKPTSEKGTACKSYLFGQFPW
jgi:hypothetical protein